MAEVVGVAASLLSIVDLSTAILKNLRISSGGLTSTDILEYEIYCEILSQVGGRSLSIFGELPDAVQTGLKLCRERAIQMETFFPRATKDVFRSRKVVRQQEAKRAIKDFGNSVKMLRDIVMDATTHTLLQDQHRYVSENLAKMSIEINDLKMHIRPSDNSDDPDDQEHQEQLNNTAEELQAKAARFMSGITSLRQGFNDPFSFEAAVIHAHSHDSGRTFVHAKMDTGCEDNWIALEILERAVMDNQVNELDIKVSYVAFGGQEFEPLGTIDVTWYATNSGKSRKTRFLVLREVPYDLVLGKRWILEEGWAFFQQPAMGLRMGKFSKEEHRIIEENARKKGATESQISEIRRANDATSRDRLREQKAASLSATPAFSSSHNRSTVSLSMSQLYSPQQPLSQDTDTSSLLTSEGPQPTHREETAQEGRNT